MIHREWTEEENKIIQNNYPDEGVLVVTKLLHAAGFTSRDYLSVMRQASKLKVKRIRKQRKDRLVKSL